MDGVCPFAEWIPGVTTFNPGHLDRVGFCDHAAGGYMSTMRRASFWNGAGVSTHFAVGRDGSIIQLVNIFDTAYAQGRLGPAVSWKPYQQMGWSNPNMYLISTEHEDWENGHAVPGSEWTQAQYDADLRLKRWCVDEVKRVLGKDLLRFGIDSLAGHYMFDSVNRAECPGRFWRDDYHGRLYADLTEAPVNEADEMELADRRAAALVVKEINFPQGDDALYRPVSVAEDNGMLYIEFWNRDRTRPAQPTGIWVRRPQT